MELASQSCAAPKLSLRGPTRPGPSFYPANSKMQFSKELELCGCRNVTAAELALANSQGVRLQRHWPVAYRSISLIPEIFRKVESEHPHIIDADVYCRKYPNFIRPDLGGSSGIEECVPEAS